MNIKLCYAGLACAIVFTANVVHASDEEALTLQLDEYEKRLDKLERRTSKQETKNTYKTGNEFNPALSVSIDGLYASYKNNPDDYVLPGYSLGGESELSAEGFSLGHTEIIISSNIDDKFFGQLSLALAEHDDEVELELEEAFFETLTLGHGLTIRGGRFYSGIGYLNQQHQHVWDFHDAPLVYRGIFGNQYFDDGLRVTYIAPTDLYIELGLEAFAGGKYPAGGGHSNAGVWTGFINFGGDIGISHSWLAGLSYWDGDDIEREYGGHEEHGVAETPLFEGDSQIVGVNMIYKWAPEGNSLEKNFKLQFEYFDRDEEGDLTLLDSFPLEASRLKSEQQGWYLQAIWQFDRNWRTGVRYDALDSDNSGNDAAVLDEAGLVVNGHEPTRSSIMAEWLPSGFSRIRLQYNRDDSYQDTDHQLFLQYTFSLGAHGAHNY